MLSATVRQSCRVVMDSPSAVHEDVDTVNLPRGCDLSRPHHLTHARPMHQSRSVEASENWKYITDVSWLFPTSWCSRGTEYSYAPFSHHTLERNDC